MKGRPALKDLVLHPAFQHLIAGPFGVLHQSGNFIVPLKEEKGNRFGRKPVMACSVMLRSQLCRFQVFCCN